MKRLALIAITLGTGCSVFFDPGKIPCKASTCATLPNSTASCEEKMCSYVCAAPFVDADNDLGSKGSNGCEACSPSACLAVPNTVPGCVANACVYSCAELFLDSNKDLNKAGSNGCELACAATAPVPDELHALVGNPSGAIHWLWDPPADGGLVKSYELCTGSQPSQLGTCSRLMCSQPMGGFSCSATTLGLPNNKRHYARLQTHEPCGKISAPDVSPTLSATPIDGQMLSASSFATETGCDAGIKVDGGVLRLNQVGGLLCLSAALFGDDEWDDFTLRVEARIADNGRGFFNGVAFHYPSTSPKSRSALVFNHDVTNSEANTAISILPAGDAFEHTVATSVEALEGNRWLQIELISLDGVIAAGFAPVGDPAEEVLRWHAPSSTLSPNGRFGLYLLSSGNEESVEFRNLTVSTWAELPDAGSGSRKLNFKASSLPTGGIRVVGGPNVRMVSCPSFPAAVGCLGDGGCRPEPGSFCIEIDQTGLKKGSLSFDQPIGLDPTRPWRLSFKFATLAEGNNAQILRTLSGNGSILRGPAVNNTWAGQLSSFGVDIDAGFGPNTWNRVDYTFTDTSYALKINDTVYATPPIFPPNSKWDAHLGAFIIGGPVGFTGNVHGWWTDIEISQPP